MRIAHYRIVVHGRVQGVGYRQSALEKARASDLAATAQNLPDGTVELHVEGPLDLLKEFLTWVHQGPMLAQVTYVEHEELPTMALEGTRIIR